MSLDADRLASARVARVPASGSGGHAERRPGSAGAIAELAETAELERLGRSVAIGGRAQSPGALDEAALDLGEEVRDRGFPVRGSANLAVLLLARPSEDPDTGTDFEGVAETLLGNGTVSAVAPAGASVASIAKPEREDASPILLHGLVSGIAERVQEEST